MEPTVVVSMRRTYGYRGKNYGPGSNVTVPEGLASALGLLPNAPRVDDDAPETAPLPTLSELSAHLATLDFDGLCALQSRDERKGAIPIYEARIAELAKAGDEDKVD